MGRWMDGLRVDAKIEIGFMCSIFCTCSWQFYLGVMMDWAKKECVNKNLILSCAYVLLLQKIAELNRSIPCAMTLPYNISFSSYNLFCFIYYPCYSIFFLLVFYMEFWSVNWMLVLPDVSCFNCGFSGKISTYSE